MPSSITDLSGVSKSLNGTSSNPFDSLIDEAKNESKLIQSLYEAHRTNRNIQQEAHLLSPDFQGMTLDPVFLATLDPANDLEEVDPRHCLVFWARPPTAVWELVAVIQKRLREAAPNIYLMPPDRLHMNVFEITHSRTARDISDLETQLAPRVPEIVNWTFHNHSRLVKPLLGYDASAVALTFVPASGRDGDGYSYHHLRRDLYKLCTSTGVQITSRYTVPSAHLTIARFTSQVDFASSQDILDSSKVTTWVDQLKSINEWLRAEYWPKENTGSVEEEIKRGGEWIVGQEKGLDHRRGTLWYGGGETVMAGKGF